MIWRQRDWAGCTSYVGNDQFWPFGSLSISMRRSLMFILPYGHIRHAMYHPESLKSFWVIGNLSLNHSVTVKVIISLKAIIQRPTCCDIMVILAILSRVIKCPSAFKMSFHKFGYDYFRLRRQWMHSQNKNACFTSCFQPRKESLNFENNFLNASISCLGTRYCLIIFLIIFFD